MASRDVPPSSINIPAFLVALGTFQVEITIGKFSFVLVNKFSSISLTLFEGVLASIVVPTATPIPVNEALFKKILWFYLNHPNTYSC